MAKSLPAYYLQFRLPFLSSMGLTLSCLLKGISAFTECIFSIARDNQRSTVATVSVELRIRTWNTRRSIGNFERAKVMQCRSSKGVQTENERVPLMWHLLAHRRPVRMTTQIHNVD